MAMATSLPAEVPAHWRPHVEWLGTLLSDSREVVSTLLLEPLYPLDELRGQVLSYRQAIADAPTADHLLGAQLVEGALALIDAVSTSANDLHRRLAQVAVRYFVMDDDGDDDLMSPFGFDDDVEVFNAVVEKIGLDHLLIYA
jgi:hypothetical protein